MITFPNYTTLNKITNIKMPAFKGERLSGDIKTDAFVKAASREKVNPSEQEIFSENSKQTVFERFSEFAEKSGLLSSITDMVSSKNFIGEGYEGTTYSIQGCNDFIIKVLNEEEPDISQTPCLKETKNNLPELNIGQEIAIIDVPVGNGKVERFHILQKQNGKPAGLSFKETNNVSKVNIQKILKKHIKYLKKLANAPQKTYDTLIDDILLVKNAGYKFDCNSSDNFFFDDDTQTINFIDLGKPDVCSDKDTNQFEDILSALVNGVLMSKCNRFSDCANKEKETVMTLSAAVVDKYTTAMKNKNVKFADNPSTELLIFGGYLCKDCGNTIEDKKEYLRKNNLLE